MSDGRHAAGQLADAQREFLASWQTLQAGWRDDAQREFAERFVEPLLAGNDRAARAIDDLIICLQELDRLCT